MAGEYPRQYSTDRVEALLGACNEFDRGYLRLAGKRRDEVFGPGRACGAESGWLRLWSLLGELVVPLYYGVKSDVVTPAALRAAQTQAFAFAGSPERLVHDKLDDIYRQTASVTQRGKNVLRDLVAAVDELVASMDERLVEGAVIVDDGAALTQQEAEQSRALITLYRDLVLRNVAELVGIGTPPPPTDWAAKPKGEITKKVWLRGLEDVGAPIQSLPGVLLLTRSIASALATNSGVAAALDDDDPFSILSRDPGGVPASIARKFADGAWLIKHRKDVAKRYDYHHTGIRDPGTTELDRIAFRYVFDGAEQRSFVVLAPTSSGKSRLGHLAVIEAVHRAHREGRLGKVVVLVPTKALVNQTARDFRRLLGEEPETADWSVFEGSRDYPQYDDRIRNGRFDVAVCIPEKLSALLRVGMSLKESNLVVVDELQHLVDESRGQALELLMIELFRDYPHLRWIGLSASLAIDTQDMIQRWFERNHREIGVHRAESRPVPVVLAATNGDIYVEHSPDQTNSERTGVHTEPPHFVPRLANTLRDRGTKYWAASYARTLAVICAMIKPSPETVVEDGPGRELPSVLVFVSSRKAAENLPVALEAIAGLAGVLPPIERSARPYVDGRFEPFEDRPGEHRRPAEELLAELELMPPGSMRRHITDALTSGIGFHTSTLSGHARETVEDAFRQGYIRILFATDTLKLGVNLPADIVVNADLLLNTGAGQKLMNKDAVIQRFGRAGRLGVSRGRRGTGYLVVPEKVNVRDASTFEIGLDERVGLTGDGNSSDARVMTALTDIAAAFRCYLTDLDGGARYSPSLNDAWLHDAVLRLLCATPTLSMDAESLATQAQRLFESSFAGVTEGVFPVGVVERLEAAGAVRILPDASTRVTRLGRIAAGNALGLQAAETVANLATAALEGAGPLTMLYVASLCDAARTSSFQMVCDSRMSPGERRQVLQVAAKLGRIRRETPRMRAFFRLQDSADDLFGTGRRADELRHLLTADAEVVLRDPRMTADHITAVWRATALCHWWGGSPLSYIETMVDASKWRVDESDLRQVAEGTANLVAAASDYLGTDPVDMTFRSLLVFSQEVEIGLPIVLTSLVRTNDRTMHRERLVGLLDLLLEPGRRWDQLTDLLAAYASERSGVPAPEPSWRPLTPELLAKIDRHLTEQDVLYREAAFIVSRRVEDSRIPSSGPTMAERLRAFQRGTGINEVKEMLEAFGLQVMDLPTIVAGDTESHGVRVILPTDGGPVDVVVAAARVDHAFVDALIKRVPPRGNTVAIATMGATPGVLNHSRFLTTPCAVVEPSLFLEMLARVQEAFTVDAEFDWIPAQVDLDGARRLLARMIVNNAPVLTRQDLESRLAHDKLVADRPNEDGEEGRFG